MPENSGNEGFHPHPAEDIVGMIYDLLCMVCRKTLKFHKTQGG